MSDLVAFLTACLDRDEEVARAAGDRPWLAAHSESCDWPGDMPGYCDCRAVERAMAQVRAKRAILRSHESWPVLVESALTFESVDPVDPDSTSFRISKQIAWTTEREYRERFGSEPPAAPMLLALAQPYAGEPGWDEGWRL